MDRRPATVRSLAQTPETGTWFRAVQLRFLSSALAAAHTMIRPTRYNAGRRARRPFPTLYFADSHQVALFEVQALFGAPISPIPNPGVSCAILNVSMSLSAVADLTQRATIRRLRSTAQELTGDWRGYRMRRPVGRPVGTAPTQKLGRALHHTGVYEGFQALSARVSGGRVLVVFPDRLQAGSFVNFAYTDAAGDPQEYVVANTWTAVGEQRALDLI